MTMRSQVIKALQELEAAVKPSDDLVNWVAAILVNDEASSDSEMADHFKKEGKVSNEIAWDFVRLRQKALKGRDVTSEIAQILERRGWPMGISREGKPLESGLRNTKVLMKTLMDDRGKPNLQYVEETLSDGSKAYNIIVGAFEYAAKDRDDADAVYEAIYTAVGEKG